MVVKVLKDHDPEHLKGPVTVAEFKRVLKEIVTAMVVFGVLMTVALAISLSTQRDTARQASAIREQQRAIQRSRFDSVRDNCIETNERNRDTRQKLGVISTQGPANRDLDKRRGTILINALVPVRPDCDAYAHARVTAKP